MAKQPLSKRVLRLAHHPQRVRDDAQYKLLLSADKVYGEASAIFTRDKVLAIEEEIERMKVQCHRWHLADCGD